MSTLKQTAAEFLSHRRIALAGASGETPNAGNIIYRRLRSDGFDVFAVNPHADLVEGDRCFHELAEIEGGVDVVVVATPPAASVAVVQDCVRTGTSRVWLHRAFGEGTVSADAVALCEREGIHVIAGACPMMFLQPVDVGHRCIRWVLSATGKLPRPNGNGVPQARDDAFQTAVLFGK